MKFLSYCLLLVIVIACQNSTAKLQLDKEDTAASIVNADTLPKFIDRTQATISETVNTVENKQLIIPETTAHKLVSYAKTLIGTPYLYGSVDPYKGFDCSGFITHVFNHFNIQVPRSSVDFTNIGQPIDVTSAKEGDLILFTGTNESIRTVGHMGIITENTDTLRFIHSTSGRAYGVTISNLNEQYKKRLVKVIRISRD